jgi:hypothetical protein
LKPVLKSELPLVELCKKVEAERRARSFRIASGDETAQLKYVSPNMGKGKANGIAGKGGVVTGKGIGKDNKGFDKGAGKGYTSKGFVEKGVGKGAMPAVTTVVPTPTFGGKGKGKGMEKGAMPTAMKRPADPMGAKRPRPIPDATFGKIKPTPAVTKL